MAVLDATIAGPSANSYLTVAEADGFAQRDLGPEAEAWLAAPEDVKERALMRAATDVDEARPSILIRYTAAQALDFPRDTDWTGSPAVPFIPGAVKRAAYLQAAFVVRNSKAIDDAAGRRARGLYSFSDDDLSGTISLDATLGLFSPRAQRVLASVGGAGVRRSGIISVPMVSDAFGPLPR